MLDHCNSLLYKVFHTQLINESTGCFIMKKTILLFFIMQLTTFTILGATLFFRYRYLDLFYRNVSYIDVLVSDNEAFDAFLSWIKERNITASRVSVSPDNNITLHLSDLTCNNELKLLEGRLPLQGEFVSDIDTGISEQSGTIKKILPKYNFKIYGLYEPEQLNFSGLYAIELTSKNEINEMIYDLAAKKVTIRLNEIMDGNSFLLLLASFSSIQIILALIFICFSVIIIFVLLIQSFLLELKSIKILISLGCGWLRILQTIMFDLFSAKIWVGVVSLLYITLSIFLLGSDVYRPFYTQVAVIFLAASILLFLTYALILSCILSIYLIIKRNKLLLFFKGLKPYIVVQIAGCCVKFVSVALLMVAFSFLGELYGQFSVENRNIKNWEGVENIYKVSMNDIGQGADIAIEVELHEKVTNLYNRLTTDNNAFFMDANDIYAMEVLGENYPLTGLLTNGYHTHITVSPNYFHFNPIFTSEGIPVEQKLIFSESVLNLLVPESLSSIHDQLNEQFLDYFDFYRFRIFEQVYRDVAGDSWSSPRQEKLAINIIPVKNDQFYFTFSSDIRKHTGNKILDPVVVVYTGNFHPSSTFTKASRCLFFQYDNSQYLTPDAYLAEIVGMNGFVFASSVWTDVTDKVSQFRSMCIGAAFLLLFIFGGYLVINFILLCNYFVRSRYSIAVKDLHRCGSIRRFSTIFTMLLLPVLLALLVFMLVPLSAFVRFLPSFSLQIIFVVGMFLVVVDIIYFVFMEQFLTRKSVNI